MDDKELHRLLFSAIQHHNESLLNDLLVSDDGARLLDIPGPDGNVLLHAAVMENDLSCVECLLRHGACPNIFDTNRARSPLHLAVELGQTDIVKTFLELEHVDLELRDDRNLTCLEIAQFCDNQNLADIICERQNYIERIRNDFYSIMNQACTKNDPKLVKDLLDKFERQVVQNLPKGWTAHNDSKTFARSSLKQLINWSSSSWNDVTLLFKSASLGHTEVCKVLIDYGAAAKCNDNTNYSPLYVAAYGGFTKTVKLLLDNFPILVQEITIEKWTVLHACCLQGHSEVAKLILNYPYPDVLKSGYTSRSSSYEYKFAFDLNAQDAAGQTAVYLAVSANDEKLLDTMLQFNIEANLIDSSISTQNDRHRSNDKSKQRSFVRDKIVRARVISNDSSPSTSDSTASQFDRLLGHFRKCSTDDKRTVGSTLLSDNENLYLICPFEMDTYCDYNSKTALHLAVCQQYHSIATTLLVNGSNPNLPILTRDSIKNDFMTANNDLGLNWLRSSRSTCLKEACRLNDETMCEILIRYGASDNPDNLALQVAAMNKNSRLISMFLSLKTNVDSEYKINKKCNVEFTSRFKQTQKLSKPSHGNTTTTFSSMFPSSPVTIDWQNLKCIKQIDPQWLIDASLMHNKRLRHPTNSLMSITRLDLSSNNLKSIHPVIFRLPSLRELNLSKNRLESLVNVNQRGIYDGDTTSKLIESQRYAMKRSKSSNLSTVSLENSNMIDLNEPQEWDLPCLETLDLHDNLLISLPDCLFQLPKLKELDISANQIRQFPWAIWTAPSLKELIASGNLLDDLPKAPSQSKNELDGRLSSIRDSPIEEGDSLTSNQSFDKFENSTVSSSCESDFIHEPTYAKGLNVADLIETTAKRSHSHLEHINHWQKRINLVSRHAIKSSDEIEADNNFSPTISKLSYLNLSHNSFTSIPPVLACITTDLTRLNLSYNRLETLGDISLYPSKLKNLDMSRNQISSWFSTNQHQDCDTKHCYADSVKKGASKRGQLCCPHKLHHRLESLKSLNLSHNLLSEIQIYQMLDLSNDKDFKYGVICPVLEKSDSRPRRHLIYPNVTALDLSFNRIRQVPRNMSDLKDLSVLNLNGNSQIATLPAELGLASKLWNLGVVGCHLSEPLKSIVESKTYKTMDIIGYLRSILEESKPYARMKLMLVGLQGIGKTSLLEQMRHEGSSGSRRRAPEHWTRRMGHSSRGNLRNQKGVTLSTVGVDIHDWIFCKKTSRNQPSFGPVTFSTWDFGGQDEFYATHRYFLSKRSIYLVVWRLTDGFNGIQTIQQWLVNIQSRASGSPVVIVGTHEDMIDGGERSEIVQQLQAEVHKRFINISDQDKCGLPRVMDSIVVSTKSKYNIKNLCNMIYDIVFSLRCPGSTERLLEQKIPATYLYLEEIVSWIIHDRQQRKKEPVLTYEEYKKVASEQLKTRYNKVFRDLEPLNSRDINYNSELHQATRFLHENGILLHYEDSNLRDLYFLDPQWLCDILSHVVTIREINPHVKNGLMKIEDLGHLFKSMDVQLSGGIQSYVVNLLNKFEVALTWNSQYLLIPSLLPNSPDMIDRQHDFKVNVVPRMRGRSAVRRYESNRSKKRSTSIDPKRTIIDQKQMNRMKNFYEFEFQSEKSMTRLIMLRYLPDGFLSRFQSGLLSDPMFDDICADLHWNLVDKTDDDRQFTEMIGSRAGWLCWKHGIKLSLQKESTINTKRNDQEILSPCLLTIQEMNSSTRETHFSNFDFKIDSVQIGSAFSQDKKIECSNIDIIGSNWCDLNVEDYSNIILITVPNLHLKVINREDRSERYLSFDHQNNSRLLSRTVDHLDSLLEDWYPSLGARFAHTLGGNYLVARVIPCRGCLDNLSQIIGIEDSSQRPPRRQLIENPPKSKDNIGFKITSAREEIIPSAYTDSSISQLREVYCYYVEHCILNAYNLSTVMLSNRSLDLRRVSLDSFYELNSRRSKTRNLQCPKHGPISLKSIAPDILFDDISDELRIDKEHIERCKLIGRGMMGFVFKGSLRSTIPLNQLGQANQEIALKLLQPVDPGPEAEQNDIVAYKSALTNWTREPFQSACKSYCTARHEINILQALNHPNIVSFIGVCLKPLALVLELAPLGSLADVFKDYKRAGMRIDQLTVQKTILQVARALEFLHQQRVIYRDLKTENILVWSFPSPYATQLGKATVELKLADYGISRQALSTGIWKGFAGTISFLAPEILRHNGDEEYTEKVDCFSFGMFMYELLTLRPPFKHNEGSKSYLNDGGRPTLTQDDIIYPSHVLDLMSVCWSQEPQDRPTASQIVSIASTPEFMQILDIVELKSDRLSIGSYCALQKGQNLELWFGEQLSRLNVVSTSQGQWNKGHKIETIITDESLSTEAACTSTCVVEKHLWLCDSNLILHTIPIGHQNVSVDLDRSSSTSGHVLVGSEKILSFPLNLRLGISQQATVTTLINIETAKSIIALTSTGQLWISRLIDGIDFKRIELGSEMQFNCVTLSDKNERDENKSSIPNTSNSFILFCGQSNGISSLEICDGEVRRQSILPLTGLTGEVDAESVVECDHANEVTHIATFGDLVWTAASCTVHLWNIIDKHVTRKLDCWKLVPCSESLESINIEEYYHQSKSSFVTSIVYTNQQLFVATSHGCFIIIEADILKPMVVFRPFESDLIILKPIVVHHGHLAQESTDSETYDNYLVILGKGYRDLMQRYVSTMEQPPELGHGYVAILLAAHKYNL